MVKSKCYGETCCVVRPLRFQYGKNKRGQWYWHIRAANGEIIAEGEGYKRVAKIHRLFELLKDGAGAMALIDLSPAGIRLPVKKRGFIG